jgi:hypothetical protein
MHPLAITDANKQCSRWVYFLAVADGAFGSVLIASRGHLKSSALSVGTPSSVLRGWLRNQPGGLFASSFQELFPTSNVGASQRHHRRVEPDVPPGSPRSDDGVPTRAVPLKTPETVIDGWASLRRGIESKDLTPLAILSPEPSALLPDLTVAAAIVPGFTSIGWQALTVRSGTPGADRACPRRQPAQDFLDDPQLQKRLLETGPQFQPGADGRRRM